MIKKNDDDYYILLKGAKLNKREANKAGVGIIFGFIGAVTANVLPISGRVAAFLIIAAFAITGYGLGQKLIK
jgi:hypothetical protein